MKVDKLLKEDCEKNGDYCEFNRRFLNVLNRLPSLSDYNAWSLKKHGSTAQNVQMKLIKDAVKENFGESLDEMPKTTDEFLTRIEDYDFDKFFQKQLEALDDEQAPTDQRDDSGYLDLDAKILIFERFYNMLKGYSEKPTEVDDENDADACYEITYYSHLNWFSALYDGPYLSLGKIFDEESKVPDSELISKFESDLDLIKSKCDEDFMDTEELKERLKALKTFIDMKKFDDGFSSRKENPSFCKSSNVSTTNQCRCECHKEDKVAIYNIYAAIQMIQKDLDIKRFGDIYTYYYYDVFRQHPAGVVSTFSYPRVNQSIEDEINAFEREVLKELRYMFNLFDF